MRSATKATVSTFGVVAAVAGIEHGIGEILQGNVAPEGLVIESWAGSELFAILAGEPAMTLIPNLLISGILSILVSLIFMVWVVGFIDRKNGGLVLIGLSLVLLLVGGGFGPPLLGIILGVAATRINGSLTWWRAHLSSSALQLLRRLWPWLAGAALVAWLLLFPGSIILDYFSELEELDTIVYADMMAAFVLLLLVILSAFAYDIEERAGVAGTSSVTG